MNDHPLPLTDAEINLIAKRIHKANTFEAGYVVAMHNVVRIDAARLLAEIRRIRAERTPSK